MKKVLPLRREQAERLQEMGATLRKLREQQGLPLEEIAGRTRIQPRLLRAIEQGNLDDLPEAVYIHSFIRQYADSVGMNGVQFASGFPTVPGTIKIPAGWRKALPGAQLRPVHLYLVYMFLIVGAVQGLSYFLNRSMQSSTMAAIELPKDAVVPSVTLGPELAPKPAAGTKTAKPANPNQKPVRVSVKLKEQSWVQVVADGKTEFEDVLPEGTTRTWQANKSVIIKAGNAGGVEVAYNDGQPKALGQPGMVEEKTFPPDAKMVANLLGNHSEP
jgi:cytoskeletal protein RodZ